MSSSTPHKGKQQQGPAGAGAPSSAAGGGAQPAGAARSGGQGAATKQPAAQSKAGGARASGADSDAGGAEHAGAQERSSSTKKAARRAAAAATELSDSAQDEAAEEEEAGTPPGTSDEEGSPSARSSSEGEEPDGDSGLAAARAQMATMAAAMAKLQADLDASNARKVARSKRAKEKKQEEEKRAGAEVFARRQPNLPLPAPLAFGEARKIGALEDWVHKVEAYFFLMGVRANSERLASLFVLVDRDVYRWWQGAQKVAGAKGAPLDTWELFTAELRANFLPVQEAKAAMGKFFDLRQAQGEDMGDYLLRAMQLYSRAQASVDNTAAMHLVMHHARRAEWPHSLGLAERAIDAGSVKTLEELRRMLQVEALAEPGKQPRGGNGQGDGSSGSSSSHHRGAYSSSGAHGRQTRRAAAVGGTDSSGGSGSEGEPSTRAAQVQNRAWGLCARCNGEGHRASECTKPDQRTCYRCQQKGHISTNCPARKEGGKEGGKPAAGAKGTQQPKNGSAK